MTRIYNAIDNLDDDVRKIPLNYVQKDDFKTAVADIKNDIRSGFQQVDRTLKKLLPALAGDERLRLAVEDDAVDLVDGV